MKLPTQLQIDAAVRMMAKAHSNAGYKRAPRDLEIMLWAALFALWNGWNV